MLRKCVLAIVLAGVTMFAAACGKDDSGGGGTSGGGSGGGATASGPDLSTPQGAMKALAEAFASLDPAKFEPIYSKEAWKEGSESMKKELAKMKEDFQGVSLQWNEADIKVEGDNASVKGKLIFKMKDGKEEDDGETFRMVKEDGKWKHSR